MNDWEALVIEIHAYPLEKLSCVVGSLLCQVEDEVGDINIGAWCQGVHVEYSIAGDGLNKKSVVDMAVSI